MKNWIFITVAVALGSGQTAKPAAAGVAAQAGASAARPNILWFIAENIAPADLGYGGEKQVRTPHIDRLARQGMRFGKVFATAPVCSASRSAFMTGMYQTTIGAHNARSHRDDHFMLPAGVRPITGWLRDAGYYTANVTTMDGQPIGTGKIDLNFATDKTLFDSNEWSDLKAHQPFCAQVNSFEVEMDIYDRKSASKKRVKWVGEDDNPPFADPAKVVLPPYYPDHAITRREWARYLDSVSGIDRRLGRVLAKLEADGLAQNTVVIFFADNGRLEARGIHWCYDSGLWVPLIVTWPPGLPAPPQYHAGTESDQVLSLLDLTATTLAIAGIPKPPGMQSRIFLGQMPDPPRAIAFSARDRIDETVQHIRTARNDRYRYIRNEMPERPFMALNRYKEKCFLVIPLMRELHRQGKLNPVQEMLMAPRLPPEELYDLANDPYEVKNLVASPRPEDQRALTLLRQELDRWIAETDDQGRFPEPPEVIAPFEREMHEWFGTPEWYRR